MPDFSRFRRSETGGAGNGFGQAYDDRMDNGLGNGFDDRMDNGLGNGFDDRMDNGLENGFDDRMDDGLENGFDSYMDDGFGNDFDGSADSDFFNDASDDFANGNYDDDALFFDESGSSLRPDSEYSRNDAGVGSTKTSRSEKVSLKSAVTALFQAVTGRFTDKEQPAGDSGAGSAGASLASDFDSAVDEGFVPERDFSGEAVGEWREAEPFPHGEPERSSDDYFRGMTDGGRAGNEYGGSGFADRDDRSGDYPESRYHLQTPDSFTETPPENTGENGSGSSHRDEDSGSKADNRHAEDTSAPEGTSRGVLAAVGASWRRFRRRLPGFRPKVYVVPEPEYTPEDDGIGTPTLASDIQRILEEQNKPGETEQEYDRMRSYIRTVSTDARIRPGDIKTPENIGEVRAAESELYGLIDTMIHTNEQQRSRIGVYETPPEEDPYNYRGINNDRQFYSDMETFSFSMNPRYGFESEEKIDPGRKYAEREYYGNGAFDGQQTRQEAVKAAYSDNGQFSDDGFDDDFDQYAGNADAGDGFIRGTDGDAGLSGGRYYRSLDGDSPEDYGLDDDFGDDPDLTDSGSWGAVDDGSDLGEIDEPDDGYHTPHPKRGSRSSGRNYENPDVNALYDEGFVDYRTKRSGQRKNFVRRGAR